MSLDDLAKNYGSVDIFKDFETFFEVSRVLSSFDEYSAIHKLDIPDNTISNYIDWVLSDNVDLECENESLKNSLIEYKDEKGSYLFFVNIFNDIDKFSDLLECSCSGHWGISFDCGSSSDEVMKLRAKIDDLSSKIVSLEEEIENLRHKDNFMDMVGKLRRGVK